MRGPAPNRLIAMPRRTVFVLFAVISLFGLAIPACSAAKEQAAQPGVAKEVPPLNVTHVTELRERLGQTARVHGRVQSSRRARNGHQFLTFYSSELTVICFQEDVQNFRDPPLESYRDKEVLLTGTLETYRGKLQIKLRRPEQLRLWTEFDGEPAAEVNNSESVAKEDRSPIIKSPIIKSPIIKSPIIKEVGRDHWLSAGGLQYQGRDPDGRSRKDHVLRHAQDDPDREGPHGVFDAQGDDVFRVIDEAWQRIEQQRIAPRTERGRVAYTVNMGRRVGFLGGSTGRERGHPALERVFLVLEDGTRNVVTAFPK